MLNHCRMNGKPLMVSAGLALLAALLAACSSHPARPTAHLAEPPPASPSGPPESPDVSVNDNPCAIQLHDIEGALLQYYLLNQRLPDKLEEIQSFGDTLDPIILTCPTSHQPYIYNPTGLVSTTTRKRIIVYDATPAHRGGRFCIMFAPQESGKGMAMDVELLSEKEFKKFVPPLNP